MEHERTAGLAGKYFLRALCLKCPVCGEKPIFVPVASTRSLRDWFTPLDGCPRCGYAYEREQGYFLLAIWAVGYGVGSLLGITLYLLLELFFDLPIWTLISAVIIPVVIFNFLFARHSKALFIALDHYFDPHERDGGEGDGNKPTEPPATPNTPSGSKTPEPAGSLR